MPSGCGPAGQEARIAVPREPPHVTLRRGGTPLQQGIEEIGVGVGLGNPGGQSHGVRRAGVAAEAADTADERVIRGALGVVDRLDLLAVLRGALGIEEEGTGGVGGPGPAVGADDAGDLEAAS